MTPTLTYEVLRPVIYATGQRGINATTGQPFEWCGCRWEVIGLAESMEDAKRKFGGYPVLQAVTFTARH
jgi:hypothetical protein